MALGLFLLVLYCQCKPRAYVRTCIQSCMYTVMYVYCYIMYFSFLSLQNVDMISAIRDFKSQASLSRYQDSACTCHSVSFRKSLKAGQKRSEGGGGGGGGHELPCLCFQEDIAQSGRDAGVRYMYVHTLNQVCLYLSTQTVEQKTG